MTLIRPRAWHAGSRIAIVSPASPFSRDDFERGCAELRRLDLEPVFDDDVFAVDGYVSGTADVRARAIARAIADPTITGLMAVRGGYGSAHLLPGFDRAAWRHARKAFVGYSDLTSILSWQACHAEMVAVQGPMLAARLALGEEGYDPAAFLDVMRTVDGTVSIPIGQAGCLFPGEAVGPIYGGTLTLLCASLGTPFAFNPPEGCLLFLEDVSERPYRLDRMLTQLEYAGIIGRARGIIVGDLVGCDEVGGPTGLETIVRLAGRWALPVIYGLASGHTRRPVITLPFGVPSRMVADETCTLTLLEPAVA